MPISTLKLDLVYCYGIKRLKGALDFSNTNTIAIYAPNGTMKSSLARTFKDLVSARDSLDRYFQDRHTKRDIRDEKDRELEGESILVVQPFEEESSLPAKAATLLVNPALRDEYIHALDEVQRRKERLFDSLQDHIKTGADFETEFLRAFSDISTDIIEVLERLEAHIPDSPLESVADLPYEEIFSEDTISLLKTQKLQEHLSDFIATQNRLLDNSTYFKRGAFTHARAIAAAKDLRKHRFFEGNHTLTLNGETPQSVKAADDLEKLVAAEWSTIVSDSALKKKLDAVEKEFSKNQKRELLRTFLLNRDDLLPKLIEPEDLRREVLLSGLALSSSSYASLLESIKDSHQKRNSIIKAAQSDRTTWEKVIDIFNSRFSVPFRLSLRNRTSLVLGLQDALEVSFEFLDEDQSVEVDRQSLESRLSTGERRALYLLNLVFDIEIRKKSLRRTLLVVDDIADSFDYKNKFAITQYLKETAETDGFKLLILTHNFDFFRTVQGRLKSVKTFQALVEGDGSISLRQAEGVRNLFTKVWKPKFFTCDRTKLASMAFMRNLIEYTSGVDDPDYVSLTSAMHWRPDTSAIKVSDIEGIYSRLFRPAPSPKPPDDRNLLSVLFNSADECLDAPEGLNLENKVVLSLASRILAEQYMTGELAALKALPDKTPKTTGQLFDLFKTTTVDQHHLLGTLEAVALMTAETIHLNAFMYEPLVDISDHELRLLYSECKLLPKAAENQAAS